MLAHAAPTLSQCDRRFPSFYVSLSHYLSVFEETKTVLFLKKKKMKGFSLGPQMPSAPVKCWETEAFSGGIISARHQHSGPEVSKAWTQSSGKQHEREKDGCVGLSLWCSMEEPRRWWCQYEQSRTVINSDCSQKGTVSHKRRVWETVSVWL